MMQCKGGIKLEKFTDDDIINALAELYDEKKIIFSESSSQYPDHQEERVSVP